MTRTLTPSRRHTHRERGMAMLLVMIAVVMASILAMGFLAAQSTNIGISENIDGQTRARAIAESGLALTLQHIQANADWRETYAEGGWVTQQAFQGGTFSVTVFDGVYDTQAQAVSGDGDLTDDVSDTIAVAVTATYNGVTHTVRSNVTPGVTQSRKLLLITPDADNLSEQDAMKAAQFEGWGYEVTALSDSASSTQYTTALEEADVVYVSEEANSGDVGSSLTLASIGVVAEEGYLFDELGLTPSDTTDTSDDTIEIINDGHYITREFATGGLVIADGSVPILTVGLVYSGGATVLANRDGLLGDISPTLSVLDAGDARYDGGVSMGRRVFLPVGGGSFDFSRLNADGLTLIKRSLAWAATEPANPVSNGLTARWFEENRTIRRLRDIDWDRTEDFATTEAQVNFANTRGRWYDWLDDNRFAVELTGQLSITEAGSYDFRLGADDGAELVIGGDTVVDNDGLHSFRNRDGSVYLSEGKHELRVRFFENSGHAGLILSWRPPGEGSYSVVPASAFASDQEETPEAQLVAGYTFEPVVITPALVAHWKLDELGAGGEVGLAFADDVRLYDGALIDAYRSGDSDGDDGDDDGDEEDDDYGDDSALARAVLTTNSDNNNDVQLHGSATIMGDVHVGPGGDPDEVIAQYGDSAITGTTGTLASEVSLPEHDAPNRHPFRGSRDDIRVNGGTTTITSDQYLDDCDVWSGTLEIDGNVTMVIRRGLNVGSSGAIELTDGSSLTVYLENNHGDSLNVGGNINAVGKDPGAVKIYGTKNNVDFELYGNAKVYGLLSNARGNVDIWNNARVFGGVVADDLEMNGSIHFDLDTMASGLGLTAAEEAGGYDGSYHGASAGEDGQHLRAAEFDGDDDYIAIPHQDAFLLDRGTVAFWFKAERTSGTQGLFSKDSTNYDDGGHLSINIENGKVECRLQSDRGSTTVDTGSNSIDADTWHHVAVQFGPLGLRIYLDGQLQDTDDYTGGLGSTSGGSGNREPIVLGASTQNSDDQAATPLRDHFEGLIDDVRVYDQPLDDSQLANIMLGNEPGDRVAPSFEIEDTSGFGTPLTVFLQDTDHVTWLDGGGLEVSDATTAASMTDASKITDAIQATNAMSVEVIFTPANVTQDGPAGIVSLSEDTNDRNFTVGQDETDYLFRIRTTDTNGNGDPNVAAEGTLTPGGTEHVIITYDGEHVKMYRDNRLEATVERTGLLSAWDTGFKLAFFNELTGGRPWLGKLYRVAVYDQALNELQAENVFNGKAPGDPTEDGSVQYRAVWVEP